MITIVSSGPQAYQSLSTHGMVAVLCLGTALGVERGGRGWLCSRLSGFAQPVFPELCFSSKYKAELALMRTSCRVAHTLGDGESLDQCLLLSVIVLKQRFSAVSCFSVLCFHMYSSGCL